MSDRTLARAVIVLLAAMIFVCGVGMVQSGSAVESFYLVCIGLLSAYGLSYMWEFR